MNILAFDTCFDACSVAVSAAGTVTAERQLMRRGHAEALLPMIGRTMTRAALSFAALDRIAVTNGPGSFTGTRVGIAAALGLSFAHDVPVVTFSALQCIARAAIDALGAERTAHEAIVVARDAKRDSVYIEVTDISGNERLPPQLLTIAEARTLIDGHRYVFIGNGSQLLASQPGAAKPDQQSSATWLEGIEEPDARYLLTDAASRTPTKAPRPLYLRPPDATPSAAVPLARISSGPRDLTEPTDVGP